MLPSWDVNRNRPPTSSSLKIEQMRSPILNQSFGGIRADELNANPLLLHPNTKSSPTLMGQFWETAVKKLKTPSLPAATGSLSILSLVVLAICLAIVTEILYHRTLDDFAKSSLNLITTRVVLETSRTFVDIERTLDQIIFAGYQMGRRVPSEEDEAIHRSGIVAPLAPSIANASTRPFSHNVGSKIPNTTLTIDTWRDYFGSHMSATKLSARQYYSNFDVVFTDGAYMRMETDHPTSFGSLRQNAVLLDGSLQQDIYDSNQTRYFTRRTPLGSASGASSQIYFDRSTIIADSDVPYSTDRRLEPWYVRSSPPLSSGFTTGDFQKHWMVPEYNITTGSIWVNVVAPLLSRSSSGTVRNIGKVRMSLSTDDLGWYPPAFRKQWLPNVRVYTVSYLTGLLVGGDEFYADSRNALHRTKVPIDYKLTADEATINCVLTPSAEASDDGYHQIKTCRHTVATFENKVLQKAWEETRILYNIFDFSRPENDQSLLSGKVDTLREPVYQRFKVDGIYYRVSSATTVAPSPFPQNSANPDWVVLVIVPESEVTGVLSEVRTVIIIVTCCLTFCIAVVFALGAHRILKPINAIAELMTLAAYMRDQENGDTTSSNVEVDDMARAKLKDRTLSRWAEVRSIQSAYWAMSDELQALKAYIPVHLRDEILTKHRNSNSSERGGFSPRSEEALMLPLDTNAIDLDIIEKPEVESNGPPENLDFTQGTDHSRKRLDPTTTSINVMSENDILSSTAASDRIPVSSSAAAGPTIHSLNPLAPRGDETSKRVTSSLQVSPLLPYKAPPPPMEEAPPTIFFLDSCLIDREITVVHINIIAFHKYARRRHPTSITADYAEFISFINTEVKRYGGVLESFFGDKIWVSFNATSKCVHHQVAACYFAYHVTSITNKAAKWYQDALPREIPADGSRITLPYLDKRFAIAANGINSGIATGQAFVGPLGNAYMKRHTIISNAISEAAALERQSLHYAGSNALISSDMFPHIEGYCQYMLLDATMLPGSQGKRRTVACLAGPMLSSTSDASVISKWLKSPPDTTIVGAAKSGLIYSIEYPEGHEKRRVHRTVPNTNRLLLPNEGLLAVLDGNMPKARQLVNNMIAQIAQPEPAKSLETASEVEERKAMMSFMVRLIQTFLENGMDGRTYVSPLGDAHIPFIRLLEFPNENQS